MKLGILISCILFFQTILYAQIRDNVLLPEIEIKSSLTQPIQNGNFIIKTKIDSQNWKLLTLGQQINPLTNLSKMYSPGGLSTVSIRGMTAAQTNYYWNGLLINSPLNGTFDMNQLYDWASSTRLLLNKSTGPQYQGNSGPGGTLWAETIIPSNENFSLGAFVSSGSFNRLSGGIKTKFMTGPVRHLLSVIYDQSTNNYPYPNPNIGQEKEKYLMNADFTHLQLNYAAALGNTFHLKLHHHKHDASIPLAVTATGIGSRQEDADTRFVVDYMPDLKNWNLKIMSGGSYQLLNYYPKINVSKPIIYNIWQFNLLNGLVSRKIANHNVSFCASEIASIASNDSIGRHVELDSRFTLNIQNPEKNDGLLYGGTGQLQVKQPYKPVSLRIYGGLTLGKTKIVAAFATNYRIPTINDRYWPLSGNPDLKPEYTKSFEIITKTQFSNQGKASLSLYYNTVSDWIQWIPGGSNGLWKPFNLLQVKVKGVDFNTEYSWKRQKWQHELTGTINMAVSQISKDYQHRNELIGKILTYTPILQTEIQYFVCWDKLSAKLSYSFASKRYSTTDNNPQQALDPIHEIDLALNYNLSTFNSDWNLGIRLNNLLNQTYYSIPYRPLPRFNWVVTIGYELRRRN